MRPFTLIAAFVFACVAMFHLVRIFCNWQVLINGSLIPQWVSIIGFLVSGFLSVMLFREGRKK